MAQSHGHAVLRASALDDVAVALRPIAAGSEAGGVVASETIPAAHKIALHAIAAGGVVRKSGLPIGIARADIAAGALVHSHNLSFDAATAIPALMQPSATPALHPAATFQGFVRPDGRVGTRNFIGLFVVGNCGATAARKTADWFDAEKLAAFPNVDGVVPFVHELGCGMEMTGEPMDLLRRTISGTIRNPNMAGAVVVALGCERNNLQVFLDQEQLERGDMFRTVTIQDVGGIANTLDIARGFIAEMLPLANRAVRQSVPVARLVVGVQSATPDGFSGLSANPALGAAMDLLVAQGGTVILSETPEIIGMEHSLAARAATPEIAAALLARVDWWRDYNRGRDTQLNGRLNPASAAAGLATLLEKSVDGISKGGASALMEVRRYAEQVQGPGLVFMDTPDNDAVAVTGQIAGGAILIAMTTGLGTAFGSLPAPTLKLASNTETFTRLQDDIDLNCGVMLDGDVSVAEMGRRIFDALLRHASGEPTKGEIEGMGENEFVPWPIGVFA